MKNIFLEFESIFLRSNFRMNVYTYSQIRNKLSKNESIQWVRPTRSNVRLSLENSLPSGYRSAFHVIHKMTNIHTFLRHKSKKMKKKTLNVMFFHDEKMSSKKNYHWLMSPDLFFLSPKRIWFVCVRANARACACACVCLLITHLGRIKTNALCMYVVC